MVDARCGSERSATVKKQAAINGLLPALRAGPFHLLRLHLDLRSDVLKKLTVTFPPEKCFCTFQRSLGGLFIELLSIDKLHTGDHFGDEFGSIQPAPVLLGLGTELEDHG